MRAQVYGLRAPGCRICWFGETPHSAIDNWLAFNGARLLLLLALYLG
ncbi:hypothetical protein CJA_3400 [Cellvibrio japonicus Ueda107]|uniref:Uncharacterized protein n=1 Tax=Cellvibrio japonicus (strain Ueda107) TaxID=498211 RepID=B3PF86_CELJU|nr:hypothetical protein CJA_3400 [Cellvibrio japonicus Ueda107]